LDSPRGMSLLPMLSSIPFCSSMPSSLTVPNFRGTHRTVPITRRKKVDEGGN
jgi:hypothetical protein